MSALYRDYLSHRVQDAVAVLAHGTPDQRKQNEVSLAWRVRDLSTWLGDGDLSALPEDVATRVRRHRA